MEGQPRSGGGASWGPPPPPPAETATRAAAGGPRPTTTHQQQPQQQVKVKHIVTREVSTDVANFKDVVQRLTGKDSAAARAAVVADGAGDHGTTSWSGGDAAVAVRGATTSTGVASGAVVFEDNGAGAGAGATRTRTFMSEEDTMRWWRGA